MNTSGKAVFKNLIPRIDTSSFPLKTIDFMPEKPHVFHYPIVQTAERFRMFSYENMDFLEPWHRTVLSLPHKHIIMSQFIFDKEQILSVVQDWLDHPRGTGNTLVMHKLQVEMVKMLCAIAKKFNGKVIKTPEVQTKGYFGDHRDIIYHKAILLPLHSTTSQLLVTGYIWTGIKLEIVPIDSINPIVPASLNYWDVICLSFEIIYAELGYIGLMVMFCPFALLISGFYIYLNPREQI